MQVYDDDSRRSPKLNLRYQELGQCATWIKGSTDTAFYPRIWPNCHHDDSDGARKVRSTQASTSSGILTPCQWTKSLENVQVRTSTYRVRTRTCQYENKEIVCTRYVRVQEFRYGTGQVCTVTFRNLFVEVCTSINLPWSRQFLVV
jgi:hypothetical protein